MKTESGGREGERNERTEEEQSGTPHPNPKTKQTSKYKFT